MDELLDSLQRHPSSAVDQNLQRGVDVLIGVEAVIGPRAVLRAEQPDGIPVSQRARGNAQQFSCLADGVLVVVVAHGNHLSV